jgi:hypothetical protein
MIIRWQLALQGLSLESGFVLGDTVMKGSSAVCSLEMHIMEQDHMIDSFHGLQYLQLGWSVCWKLQLLLAQCQVENDLHWVETAPGPLPSVHLPQQHPKGVHINRFAELACMSMPVTHTRSRCPLCILNP